MALAALRRHIQLTVPKMVQQEARARLVATAKAANLQVLREQKARVGYEPAWTGFGDVAGRPVEDAEQMVVYKYTYRQEIVAEILKRLRESSPIDSGRYRRSHGVWINMLPVADDTEIRDQEVMLTNPVPYARRLEVGKTESGRAFLVSMPNRIYERTARWAKTRYANAAKITFGYVTLPDAWVIKGGLPSHYTIMKGGAPHKRRRRQVVGSQVRAPAIFVDML